jgi:hypothetical protein
VLLLGLELQDLEHKWTERYHWLALKLQIFKYRAFRLSVFGWSLCNTTPCSTYPGVTAAAAAPLVSLLVMASSIMIHLFAFFMFHV